MAISMTGSGVIELNLSPNRTEFTSVPSYSFCSSVVTTTANYADNQIEFGAKLQEIHIVNTGTKAVAFQFAEFFGTTKDSGIAMPGESVVIRNSLKSGIALKNADTTSSTVIVFGV